MPNPPDCPFGQLRLRFQDGTAVPVTLHRDPSLDRPAGDPRGHVTYWRAVPDEQVPLDSCVLEEEDGSPLRRPPHTGVWADVPLTSGTFSDFGSPGDLEGRR